MIYKIEERETAVENVRSAFLYYESVKEELGSEFLQSLDKFYDTLERNPEAYSYLEKPFRQGKLSRFPYVVVFEVRKDTVVVFRVFNTHQNPGAKLPA